MILLGAISWELRPLPTTLHPFAATDLSAGTTVEDAVLEWREIPAGVMPEIGEVTGHLVTEVAAGTPLVPALLSLEPEMPAGWWAFEVPVPSGTEPGNEVRLVVNVRLEPRVVPGLVVRLLGTSSLNGPTALVAVPESEVGAAAASLADGSLRTLVGGG